MKRKGRGFSAPAMFFSFFLCLLLTSCGEATQKTSQEPEMVETETTIKEDKSMENVAILAYKVPEILPGILVNSDGYQAKSEKRAVFWGNDSADTFEIRKKDNDATVFAGPISWEKDKKLGYGDFSRFSEDGEYYIFCPVLGSSRSFLIKSKYLGETFDSLVDQIKEKARSNEAAIDEIAELLLLYEWYPELFGDEDANKIPDVLEFVAGWSEREEAADLRTAAVLAKFSFLYKGYDVKLATRILNKASGIYDQNGNGAGEDSDRFFALTELYRATGLFKFRQAIEDYDTFFSKNTDYLKYDGYLFGTMTYITTHQKISMDLCQNLLNDMNARAQEKASYFKDLVDPVESKNNGEKDILQDARVIMAANYVMNNIEYNRMIGEAWNYVSGQNEFSKSYREAATELSGYLMMAGQLHAVEDKLYIEEG